MTRSRFAAVLFLSSMLLALPARAHDHGEELPPGVDFVDAGWVHGQARQIFGSFTIAPAHQHRVNVFAIGPVDANNPLDGLTLDPHFPYVHDHVSIQLPYQLRARVRFNAVRPGPNANAWNLKTRTVYINPDIEVIENPDGSFPLTPELEMPYAINLGFGDLPLKSIAVLQLGVALGILSTVEIASGVNITGWTGDVVH